MQSPYEDDLANLHATTASIENGFVESLTRITGKLSLSPWRPQHDYEKVSIGNLAPGPRRVSFTARVVNLYHEHKVHSRMPDSAKGCLKILVKDDSALVLVRPVMSFLYKSLLLTNRTKDQPVVRENVISYQLGRSSRCLDDTCFVSLLRLRISR